MSRSRSSPRSSSYIPRGSDDAYITSGRTSSRRDSSYEPSYDYDDYNRKGMHGSRRKASYSPPRRTRAYPIEEEYDDAHYYPRGHGYPPRWGRASPIEEDREGGEDDEDDWDTDYNPRDRLYLPNDDDNDDDHELGLGGFKRKKSGFRSDRNAHRSSYSSNHGSSSRRLEASHRRDPSYHKALDRRQESSTSNSASRSRPRPRPIRAGSSYGYGRSRPMHSSYHSSSRGKHSSASSASGPSVRSRQPTMRAIPWKQAAMAAARSGAMAALRASQQEGDWIGPKGTKVATAALGSALVDTFMDHKLPNSKGGVRHKTFKHVAEAVLGNLLVAPTMKKGQEKRRR